jgi:hypothetical protein
VVTIQFTCTVSFNANDRCSLSGGLEKEKTL